MFSSFSLTITKSSICCLHQGQTTHIVFYRIVPMCTFERKLFDPIWNYTIIYLRGERVCLHVVYTKVREIRID